MNLAIFLRNLGLSSRSFRSPPRPRSEEDEAFLPRADEDDEDENDDLDDLLRSNVAPFNNGKFKV